MDLGMKLHKTYLLDTNIVSEPTKKTPSEAVLTSLDAKGGVSVICAPVWYELLKGINLLSDGKKKSSLENYTRDYIQINFPILPYDSHCADLQAEIYARMLKNGTPVSPLDSQIAATALANNLIVVTRNIKDFKPIQKEFSLGVENWFE